MSKDAGRTTERITLSFPPEYNQRLDEMAQIVVQELGRRGAPSAAGGWRSELVRAALDRFDVHAFIAERKQAA